MNNPTTTEYKPTGKEIPLNVNVLVNHVHNKLDEYMYLKETTQAEPPNNPFSQPVIFTTDDGKLVQVPVEIQKQAIASWKQKSTQNPSTMPDTQLNGQPEGVFGNFEHSGTLLEQTNHMGNVYDKSHVSHPQMGLQQQFQEYDSQPIEQFGSPQNHVNMPVKPRYPTYPKYQPNPRLLEHMAEQPTQKVVVVEKDNSTLLYAIIFVVLVAVAYYVYTNKKN